MADTISITATLRDRVGKGASRAVRRSGDIPAVIYGGKEEPVSIQIPQNEIISLLNKGGFMSHTYEITVGKKKATVLPRDLQVHPVTDLPMHIDFLRLTKGAKVTVEVPVRVINEEQSPGLKRGGVINFTRHEVELSVPANAIPEHLDIDVSGLDLNEAIKISNVTLPKGAEATITDRDFTILAIVAPSGLKSAEDAKAAEEDGEAASDA